MKNIIFLFALALLLNGCTTYVVTKRTLPPEMILEKQPSKIVFKNQFEYRLNQEIKDKHEDAYRVGIDELGKTLVEFKPSNDEKVIFYIDTAKYVSANKKTIDSAAIKSEINKKCEVYGADFFLSLDSVYFNFDWEVIREENDDGSVSKTKDFYLIGDYYLTLYDSIGNLLKMTKLEKSIHYSSRPTLGALVTFKPNLDNAKDKIAKISDEAGQQYFSMFYPSIESGIVLELHTGKAFKETNALIKTQQYNEAIIILQDLAKTLNPKLAAKAQHNLDVANELKQNGMDKTLIPMDIK